MKTLKEIYHQILGGSYPSHDEYIEAMENEHPEWRLERIMSEQKKWVGCLDVMLKNFNPKWNPDDRNHSDDYWLYFDIDGKRVSTQQVHDFFVKVLEENIQYKIKEQNNGK